MAAPTTYTTADDLRYAAVINEDVIRELRGANVAAKLCLNKSLAGKPSKAMDFPMWPLMTCGSLTEGIDIGSDAISTTKATVTAGEIGLMSTITDVLTLSDILDGLDGYSGCLGRALGTKLDADICALFSGFDNLVGVSGSDFTEAQFLQAMGYLEVSNAPRPYVAVLHPQQTQDFRAALSTTTGVIHSSNGVAAGTREIGGIDQNGWWGNLYQVDIFSTTNVPTANTAADRSGGMFSRNYALGLCPKYISRTELERDASLRATEIVCTSFYGAAELSDTCGVEVCTDA